MNQLYYYCQAKIHVELLTYKALFCNTFMNTQYQWLLIKQKY